MPKCICIPGGCSASVAVNIIKYEEKEDM